MILIHLNLLKKKSLINIMLSFLLLSLGAINQNPVKASENSKFTIEDFKMEYKELSSKHLTNLREERGNHQRMADFSLGIEICAFINKWEYSHRGLTLDSIPEIYDLIFDFGDVINLQNEDFKNHCDLHLDSGETSFSFYSLSNISRMISQYKKLFDRNSDTFERLINKIIIEEFPQIQEILEIVYDIRRYQLDPKHQPSSSYLSEDSGKLQKLSDNLKQSAKDYTSLITLYKLENLRFLHRITCDYFTVEDLLQEIRELSLINDFNRLESREALLAQLIKMGELSSNKKLSRVIRDRLHTIPFSKLEDIRDCIVHQNENERDKIFKEILSGNSWINFEDWKKDFTPFENNLKEFKKSFWNDPKVTFNRWIGDFLTGHKNNNAELYPYNSEDSSSRPNNNALEKGLGSKLRQTNLYKGKYSDKKGIKTSGERWRKIKDGLSRTIDLSSLKEIHVAIEMDKNLKIYEEVRDHLWEMLESKNNYLSEEEKSLFLNFIKSNLFDENHDVISVAIAVLCNDKEGLSFDKTVDFRNFLDKKNIKARPYRDIFGKIQFILPTTCRVWEMLKPPKKKVRMCSSELKSETLNVFKRLGDTIHNVAHEGDCDLNILAMASFHIRLETARKLAQANDDPELESFFQQGKKIVLNSKNTGEEAIKTAILWERNKHLWNKIYSFRGELNSQELLKISYKRWHQSAIPLSFENKREEHLASVYNLSVGLSLLKELINSYNKEPPAFLKKNHQKLRRERNHLAHGDEMRKIVNDPNFYIHFELLPLVHEISEDIKKLKI